MPNKTSRQQAAAALKFFDWAYKNGDKMADELDYVPMPDAVRGHHPSAVGQNHRRRRQGGRATSDLSAGARPQPATLILLGADD